MTRNVLQNSSEKPLLGAVLCCTSIAPEERSILAEYAQQMGAEHKLDLTSDVTHLLVGSTNTPKYQYVAREREDVKVLRPDWIQAVRQCWMEDQPFSMHALEAEYCVPAFACLKICITGFDDLNVRAEIASAVRKNGGEYTGDLTKDVTHLIAAEPVGKKFEYATVWQKKVVSLKWYTDTIERGMQLDETRYHPSLPLSEQGVGAWNRQRHRESTIGKRVRDSTSGVEPVRKLRRTASSKFGSQTESMWGDIVGAGLDEQSKNGDRDILRPSKSMPVIKQRDSREIHVHDNRAAVPVTGAQGSDQCLNGTSFYLRDFDDQRKSIVLNALTSLGACVHQTLADLLSHEDAQSENSFIMVPHQSRPSMLPFLGKSPIRPSIVTELWLERCMVEKAYISPDDYVLGGLIEEIKAPEIVTFVVNATGFSSLETLHISKAVKMTGAKYEEVFKPQCSVLVCKSGTINKSKIFHAKQWNVAVVTESWLWNFLKDGCIPSVDRFLIQSDQDSDNDLHKQFKQNRKEAKRDMSATEVRRKENFIHNDHEFAYGEKKERFAEASASNNIAGKDKSSDKLMQPQSQDQITTLEEPPQEDFNEATEDVEHNDKKTLGEVSPNSPVKQVAQKRQLTSGPQQASLNPKVDLNEPKRPDEFAHTEGLAAHASVNEADSVQVAIQDLLNIKARAKTAAQNAEHGSKPRNKKKILGRALSNLSNSSRASNTRLSRASSIDSLNTDGIGSELAPPSANSRAEDDGSGSRSTGVSLLGRAQARTAAPLQHQTSLSIDISDPNLCRDEFDETIQEPQLTQLDYEDSEEAIVLRAKLAERKKARSNVTDVTEDTETASIAKNKMNGKRRVIKDDETILALEGQSGWGGGRRTRRKEKEVTNDVF